MTRLLLTRSLQTRLIQTRSLRLLAFAPLVLLMACDKSSGTSESGPSAAADSLMADSLPTAVPGTGLNAEYFSGLDFRGQSVRRTVPNIDFNWGAAAPVPGVSAASFTVRFSGEISAPTTGTYTFYATGSDGTRLNVNGQTVLNDYRDHEVRQTSGTIDLIAGQRVPAELEYDKTSGVGSLKLEWSGPDLARQPVPQARLFTSASPAPAPGQTFYVAPNGDNGNPGSEARPWASIDKAVNTLTPGQTVLVKNGTYINDYMFITRSGTPGRPITFRAYPGDRPVVRISTDNGGATMQGASYINLEGFDFEYVTPNPGRSAQEAIGVSVNPGVSSDAARTPRLPNHVRVIGNVVRGFPAGGISVGLADYVTVEGNTVLENARYAPNEPSGISLGELVNLDEKPGAHNIVRGNGGFRNENLLPGTAIGLTTISDGNCIILDDLRQTQSLEGYSAYLQPFLVGGLAYPAYKSQTLIENNVCAGNGGRGIHLYKSDHALVRNNTLYQNASTPGIEGELSVGSASDVHFVNNVVYARVDRPATYNYDSTGISYERNLYFGSSTLPNRSANDLVADPQFVRPGTDQSSADFHLRPGSPAIDAALPGEAPAFDQGGDPRPLGAGPDLGALESR